MNQLEAFLVEQHPEVMQQGLRLIDGREIEFGQPNNAMLKKLVKEHYAAGQGALKKFNKWLVRSENFKQVKADATTATVWNVLCMTYNIETHSSNPLLLIGINDDTYSYGTKTRIASALRLWARYTDDSALYEQLLKWMKIKPAVVPKYVLEALEKNPPYSQQEYRKLLKALEEFKGSPRYPWAWPCLRIMFTCGISLQEILHLDHAKLHLALQQGKILLPVGSGRGLRVLQVPLIEEELRFLLAFPYQWGVVADLVDPGRTAVKGSRFLTLPLGRVARRVFERAKVPYSMSWHHKLRWSAGWQYYQKTKNLVGAAQILGRRDLAQASEFLKELEKRAKVAQEEKEDEALDVERNCEEEY